MKFRKFGKALLIGALSFGAILGVTSCVQSYTVGFLLRLPARFPVRSRSNPSLHRHGWFVP